jgi:hypothetical protein
MMALHTGWVSLKSKSEMKIFRAKTVLIWLRLPSLKFDNKLSSLEQNLTRELVTDHNFEI